MGEISLIDLSSTGEGEIIYHHHVLFDDRATEGNR